VSKYIVVDDQFGDPTLAKQLEDGTYAILDLSRKADLIALLVDLANYGSELTSVAAAETELTLDGRVQRLREKGYDIDDLDVVAKDDPGYHRDAGLDEKGLVVCMSGTLQEFVERVEKYDGNL